MSIDIETVTTFTRQNTGKHLLDSGFENGRVWQQPAPTDMFRVDSDGWVSLSVTHILAENANHLTEVQEAIERALEEDENLTWFDVGPHVMEKMGWKQTARDNTYNNDSDYDQDFVWEVWQHPDFLFRDWIWDNLAIVLIYAHTGADARGGYARPIAVRFPSSDATIPLDPFVSFRPANDFGDCEYECEGAQFRLRNDYPTFVKYDRETQTLTLATKDGEEREFHPAFWL